MNAQTLVHELTVAATVVMVGTLAAAIVVMDTPALQRALRLDERRAADLQRIVEAAREHAERTGALAPDLTTLASRPGLRLSVIAPDTALPASMKFGSRPHPGHARRSPPTPRPTGQASAAPATTTGCTLSGVTASTAAGHLRPMRPQAERFRRTGRLLSGRGGRRRDPGMAVGAP